MGSAPSRGPTFPKAREIIEYVGEKIGNREADRRYNDAAMKRHHTFLFILNDRTCVDAAFNGNESRFLNHSCAPNCEAVITRGHIWLEARGKIPAGTELVYDYQFEDDPKYTEDDLRFYACSCGASNCRGTIVKTREKSKHDRVAGAARRRHRLRRAVSTRRARHGDGVRNYASYRADDDAWMLGRFVVPVARLGGVRQALRARARAGPAGVAAVAQFSAQTYERDIATVRAFNVAHAGRASVDSLEAAPREERGD